MTSIIEKTPSHATNNKQHFTIRCRSATTSECETTMYISLIVIPIHIVSCRDTLTGLKNLIHRCFTSDELPPHFSTTM
jgi:hypothetical protein